MNLIEIEYYSKTNKLITIKTKRYENKKFTYQ